jgi:hypothetical protein
MPLSWVNAKAGGNELSVVCGQQYNTLPIPVMPQNTEWFDAGPVAFAVESRVLAEAGATVGVGTGSIHVFSADRSREFLRFDCFEDSPHYHYVHWVNHTNTIWGYDPVSNGPMLDWVFSVIRDRLPEMLRGAGETDLADRVEREGFDKSTLPAVRQAAIAAKERTLHDPAMVAEFQNWYARWYQETFASDAAPR